VISYRWLPTLAALLFVFAMLGCSGGGSTPSTTPNDSHLNPEELAPEVQVQVVDMRYRTSSNTDEVLSVDPVPGIIASARTSLDIALPRINRQEIVNQLLAAAARGVQVRIVTEKGYYDDNDYKPFYNQLEDPTKNGGNLGIVTDREGLPRQMHARFIVVDQSRVVTGSYTWESSDYTRTIGDVVSILSTAVAQAFTTQFNQMYSEGHFGTEKVDNIQHVFAMGGGEALLEVYFGPTDGIRSHIEDEIDSGGNVRVAVQQFNDLGMADALGGFIQANPQRHLDLIVNNIRGASSDTNDNLVYRYFYNLTQTPPDGMGRLVFGGMGVETGPETDFLDPFVNFATMNEKLVFSDHAASDNIPSLITTTANFTAQGLDLNDEVLLVLRGAPLVNKYIRGPWRDSDGIQRWGIDYDSVQPTASLRSAGDVQELDQLALMFPYVSNDSTNIFRPFSEFPTGMLIGTISNFSRTISITDDQGENQELTIDAQMTITGTTFDGHTVTDEVPLGNPVTGEGFVENEDLNPNHRFMQVLPAGDWTIRTYILVDDQLDDRFTPSETHVHIGPGGVRNVTISINTAINTTGTTGQ